MRSVRFHSNCQDSHVSQSESEATTSIKVYILAQTYALIRNSCWPFCESVALALSLPCFGGVIKFSRGRKEKARKERDRRKMKLVSFSYCSFAPGRILARILVRRSSEHLRPSRWDRSNIVHVRGVIICSGPLTCFTGTSALESFGMRTEKLYGCRNDGWLWQGAAMKPELDPCLKAVKQITVRFPVRKSKKPQTVQCPFAANPWLMLSKSLVLPGYPHDGFVKGLISVLKQWSQSSPLQDTALNGYCV